MSTYIGNTPEGAKNLQAQLPIGSVVAWPSAVIPSGWLECNGQSTTQYPILNALVGATVPDLRGEFIRGYDHGKGTDSGRTLLSSQADDFKAHNHILKTFTDGVAGGAAVSRPSATGTTPNSGAIENTGGTETRPVNVALMYIIKAFDVVSIDSTSGVYAANKNYLINPTFSINQRGFAGGTLAASVYGYDRWVANGGGSCSVALSGNELTISSVTATTGVGIQQLLEGGQIPVGTPVTLSWEGTALGSLFYSNGGVVDLKASPITVGYDEASSGTIVEYIMFGAGTIENVKLEVGSIVTPFEYPTADEELIKCKRFYERWDRDTDGEIRLPFMAQAAGANTAYIQPQWEVEKRIAPTVTFSSAGALQISNATGTGQTSTSLTPVNISKKGGRITAGVGGGLAAGNACVCNLVVGGSIQVDAEL